MGTPFRSAQIVRAVVVRLILVAMVWAWLHWQGSIAAVAAQIVVATWALHKLVHATQRVGEVRERAVLMRARLPLRHRDVAQLRAWARASPAQVSVLVLVRGFDVTLALGLMAAERRFWGLFVLAGTAARIWADLRLFEQADRFVRRPHGKAA